MLIFSTIILVNNPQHYFTILVVVHTLSSTQLEVFPSNIFTTLLTKEEQKTYTIKFNVDTLLRGDFKTRTDGYQTLIQNGVMSINEVRSLENMNPIGDEGDERYIQLNMTTLKNINKGYDNANND